MSIRCLDCNAHAGKGQKLTHTRWCIRLTGQKEFELSQQATAGKPPGYIGQDDECTCEEKCPHCGKKKKQSLKMKVPPYLFVGGGESTW